MTPLLFHGTSAHRARAIVANGFRRAKNLSYTGTAANLTESICLAWKYGPERAGKILAVELDPSTRWQEADKVPPDESYDALFSSGKIDALRTYGGNVWLLWTMSRAHVRILPLPEIMKPMGAQFKSDGPDCGYNGDVGPLATLFWQGEERAMRNCAPARPRVLMSRLERPHACPLYDTSRLGGSQAGRRRFRLAGLEESDAGGRPRENHAVKFWATTDLRSVLQGSLLSRLI